MAKSKYIVTAAGGVTYNRVFFSEGGTLYLSDDEYRLFPLRSYIKPAGQPSAASVSAILAAGIVGGDQLTLVRNGVSVKLSDATLYDLAVFLSPLLPLDGALPPAPAADDQSGALLLLGLV